MREPTMSRIIPGGAAVATGMSIAALTVLPVSIASGGFAQLTPARFAAGIGVALLVIAVLQFRRESVKQAIVSAVVLTAFALWEAHVEHPMLNVAFFKNPRFSAASSGITLIFFAMFGSLFLMSQARDRDTVVAARGLGRRLEALLRGLARGDVGHRAGHPRSARHG